MVVASGQASGRQLSCRLMASQSVHTGNLTFSIPTEYDINSLLRRRMDDGTAVEPSYRNSLSGACRHTVYCNASSLPPSHWREQVTDDLFYRSTL